MRLKKMEYGAWETAWIQPGDAVQVDVLKECLRFSAAEQLDLRQVTELHRFSVCYNKVKDHLFKKKEYGPLRLLQVLAVQHGRRAQWVFFCDSRKLFLDLAKEFRAAFTTVTYYGADDDGITPVIHDETQMHTSPGQKRYNASRFVEEAIAEEGAKLEFLYYLLSEGKRACKGETGDCVYEVPGEVRNYQICSYPSHTEKCVILDGEDLGRLHRELSQLLPERIGAVQGVLRVKAEYGDGLIHQEAVLEKFRQSASYADAASQIKRLQEETARWTEWLEKGQVEKSLGEGYLAVLAQKISILETAVRTYELEQKEEAERKRREAEEEQKWQNSRNEGEESVQYEIKWFCADCGEAVVSIAADCESKYRYNCILLKKKDFIDEAQEYDHILVGPGGVLLIETKHWKGGVEIRSDGKWVRDLGKDGGKTGVESPRTQMRRHESLMKAILPDVAVSSVLCFSNHSVVIDGKDYFPDYPILYVDQLGDYLSRFCEKKLYTKEEVCSIAQTIEDHKVNRRPAQ